MTPWHAFIKLTVAYRFIAFSIGPFLASFTYFVTTFFSFFQFRCADVIGSQARLTQDSPSKALTDKHCARLLLGCYYEPKYITLSAIRRYTASGGLETPQALMTLQKEHTVLNLFFPSFKIWIYVRSKLKAKNVSLIDMRH